MAGAAPTTATIIKNALRKIGVIGAVEDPSGEDIEHALYEYNAILGQFNTRRRKCFFERFQDFTITTARTSYTIGTSANSANFVVSAGDRPVRIDRAQLILTANDPDSFLNIPVWNWPEYSLLAMPEMTGSWPIALYYAPEVPNGIIYPYFSQPSETSNEIRLWWWNQLETVAIGDIASDLDLPFGLQRALELSLAIALIPSFGGSRTNLEELKRQCRIAVSDFESNNVEAPKVSSTDGIQPAYGTFDYRSRTQQ